MLQQRQQQRKMSKYDSIDIPEKESFYCNGKLVDLEYEFDESAYDGYLIIWSQENIDKISFNENGSQEERNKWFEEYILIQIRIAHGIFS